MTDFGKRFPAAAGKPSAAASFQTQLALLFGIGWGGTLTALVAGRQIFFSDFTSAALLTAAGIALHEVVSRCAERATTFFSLELFFLALFGATIADGTQTGVVFVVIASGLFRRLFDGDGFAAYRRRFAVGVLLGGAAAMQWELSGVPALLWLLMATVFCLFISKFQYRKRTAVCGILLCILFFYAEHLHLDTCLFSPSIPDEAQGITLIAAAGTPECEGEPRALCITRNDHAACVWHQWHLFNNFSVARPGRTMPWGKKYDLIFCDRLPANERFRAGAILSRLAPGGVLAVPIEGAANWPNLAWRTLPGSNGSFVAARPDDPQWEIVPKKLDASLFRGKGRQSSAVISPGALTGMLVGFHSERAQFPQVKAHKTVIFPGFAAWGILAIFLLLHAVAFRRPKFSETLSIEENCLGFALIMTLIFRSLPKSFELLPVLMLFFFLYPLKIRNWLLKLTGTLAIAAALLWSLVHCILLAVAALLLTGAEFSTAFNEQMAEKPKAGRLAAATGLACGILLAAAAEHLPFAFAHIVQAALLFRIWTLIRC